MKLLGLTPNEAPAFWRLYKEAFPFVERTPPFLLRDYAQKGCGELLVITENGFAGLAILLIEEDAVLLAYLAICKEKRGLGLGSKTLEALRARFPDKKIIVEIETPDGLDASKERRRKFYLKRGFTDTQVQVRLNGVNFVLLSCGGMIDYAAYKRFYTALGGSFLVKLFLRERGAGN